MHATTVAVDLAKTVFELAFANTHWHIVARQRLNRRQFARFLAQQPATHVVMEACAPRTTGAAWRSNTGTR
jgi:transposase